jgi:hypothetical protein
MRADRLETARARHDGDPIGRRWVTTTEDTIRLWVLTPTGARAVGICTGPLATWAWLVESYLVEKDAELPELLRERLDDLSLP